MKLCLGTVQFGMDYGIYNQKKPQMEDSIKILDYAVHNGIDIIDTANAYGDAENVVGNFLKITSKPRQAFKIYSKLKPNILDNIPEKDWESVVEANLMDSLNKLGTDYLDGYLLHSSRYIFNDEIIHTLEKFKTRGLVKKIGVSIYECVEGERAFQSHEIDVIQLPSSIFDQRLLTSDFFGKNNRKIEIFSRSAFLQGLILMNEDQIPSYLKSAQPIVKKINTICLENGISRVKLAIDFIRKQQDINYLVFGVDNIIQLKENIEYFNKTEVDETILDTIAKEFENIETNIVIPSLWSKK